MKLSQFKFTLPKSQVAAYPNGEWREFINEDGELERYFVKLPADSKLMVVHKRSKDIEWNYNFRDVINFLNEDDCLLLNDTKVFPARLYAQKERTDSMIEVFLQRELSDDGRLWDAYVEPARKIRIGNKLFFENSSEMVAEIIDNTTSRGRTLKFLYDTNDRGLFKNALFRLGEAPVPHYVLDLRDNPRATEQDREDFQTIFAKYEGGTTAPATALHFTRELLKRIEIKGVKLGYLTVHCSTGGFQDIDVEDLYKHKTDSEQVLIREEVCKMANEAKKSGHKVVAVGSSVLKATESSVGTDGLLKPFEGWSNKFLFPPFEANMANALLINFYHPCTTMLMNTCAFGGYDLIMDAYKIAVKQGFKFGCFGDTMLILND